MIIYNSCFFCIMLCNIVLYEEFYSAVSDVISPTMIVEIRQKVPSDKKDFTRGRTPMHRPYRYVPL